MKLNTTTAVLDEPQAAQAAEPQQVETAGEQNESCPFDSPPESEADALTDAMVAVALDPGQPEADDDEEDGEHPLGVETKAEDPAGESDVVVLARLQQEWAERNAEIEHDIARLQIEIQDAADLKKTLADECKELVDDLRKRKLQGPPQTIQMHQRPLPFDQKEQKQDEAKQEPVQQTLPEEAPELDWILDEEEDGYWAHSRHLFTPSEPSFGLRWKVDGDDESGYLVDDSHETLLIDTGLVGVKFATMAEAQRAAEIADHRLAPQTAETPADSAATAPAAPASPAEEDARWKNVRLEKWPKPHNLAPGTLKIFAEADLHTIGDVSAYVESGKRLIDLKGFGEGKLEKYDDAQQAFWGRWKRDPEKVVREEV